MRCRVEMPNSWQRKYKNHCCPPKRWFRRQLTAVVGEKAVSLHLVHLSGWYASALFPVAYGWLVHHMSRCLLRRERAVALGMTALLQDALELEDLELEEDLFEREEAADEGTAVGIDPSTGLSAGWSVSVPGQDKDPEQLPSAGWSVTAVGDSDFEPDEGSLQTSSRTMRKVMNASKAQETVDAKQQTGVIPTCARCVLHECARLSPIQAPIPYEPQHRWW